MNLMRLVSSAVAIALAGTLLAGCGHKADLPESASIGANPVIPKPADSLIPTVNIAPAKGWPDGRKPVAVRNHDLAVNAFAASLEHPRWLYVLPNGDVLVAETNAPERPDNAKGIKGWLFGLFQKLAGAGGVSANRITLLRDANGDGVADLRTRFLEGLNSPFGMALIGNTLYVANTDAVIRFPYVEGQTKIDAPGEKVTNLPAGPINHHWTKNIIASQDGSRLYATVGSNSNVAENGLDKETNRAAILEIDLRTGRFRRFATGLRNPNGLAWHPRTGVLWTVVNERDELGSDLVPDYLTSVKPDGFYGWPFTYWGQHVDSRVSPGNPELVRNAIVPDYALGNHVAPLGLAFSENTSLPGRFGDGAFIGEHGSWNRQPHSGYKVVFVPFEDGRPAGRPIDFLTGFLSEDGEALGRPVGVAIGPRGGLLVADDVGNIIWRVASKSSQGVSDAAHR